MATENPVKYCPSFIGSLSFCFIAKLLVGIPALSLSAIAASTFFESPLLKLIAMSTTVFLLIFIAVKIDQMPVFSGKIVKREYSE